VYFLDETGYWAVNSMFNSNIPIKELNYQKKVILLIAISTLLRVVIASSLELGNSEVYYWAFAQHLQWNYFDHPPMVAWLIRLTTVNLLLHREIFVRLGAILGSAICTWLIFRLGTTINNLKTGWLAALLYTSSIYGSMAAGTFILPDSPQMVFWLYSLLLLTKISRSDLFNPKVNLLWCLFGIMSGLCIMSKVHGVFLWLGVILYIIFINRSWLKYPGIYLAALITLIIVSPIIIWNLQNNFITYQFHSSRVSLSAGTIHFNAFIKQLLAVILITNPINFFLICRSLPLAFKRELPVEKKDIRLLLCCSLPLIAILLFISLFRETYPHWPGPAYSTLLILPAIRMAASKNKFSFIPNVMKLAIAFIILLAASETILTNYFPGTSSDEKNGIYLGKGDNSLDMYGWLEAGIKFDSLYRNDVSKKIMPPGALIIVTGWYPAAHIDYYITNLTKQETFGIGNISDLHQYYWMNVYKKPLEKGDSAYYIVPSNLFDYKTFDKMTGSFMQYEMPLVISQFRSGIICKEVYVFRFKGYKTERKTGAK
jgi:Dolichyl-phosphate-mannose-protein mannosyltransferase